MGVGEWIAKVVSGNSLFLKPSQWRDDNIDILSLSIPGRPNAPGTTTIPDTNILVPTFDTGLTEVNSIKEVNHDHELLSDIFPHWHFMPTTTNTGNVFIGGEYYLVDIATNTVTTGSFSESVAVSGAAFGEGVVNYEFGAIPVPSNNVGSQLHFRLYRDGTNPLDTYPDEIASCTFGYHYKVNSAGSRQKLTK